VRFADRIAYLSHDALDAIRAGVLVPGEFPAAVVERFGEPGREWIGGMITAVLDESVASGVVSMDAPTLAVMGELRDFMFARVYTAGENARRKQEAIDVIRRLVEHHLEKPELIPATYRDNDADLVTQAADYVAGMTDRFALATHDRLFRPALAD
jgi:dGTPase